MLQESLVLILANKTDFIKELEPRLTQQGIAVVRTSPSNEYRLLNPHREPALIIIDAAGKEFGQHLKMIRRFRRHHFSTPLLLIVRQSDEDQAVAAFRAGVTDYFKQPVSWKELLISIRRHLTRGRAALGSPASPRTGITEPKFIGVSSQITKLRDYIIRAGNTDCNVLITGETGTGKERVAELIHWHSPRRAKPMIAINCAAFPETLLESELFGYERGAFTGALESYPGKMRLAQGGTLFLDEIFDMAPYVQAKLLRALDTRKIYSLGGRNAISLNIRIVASTNRDPEQDMERGTLRPDFFFRLNVARIHLPPLRERQSDIPPLLAHFLAEMNARYQRRVKGFSPETMTLLMSYTWPGNIRELRNLVEALFINLPPRIVSLAHLPESFRPLQENLKRCPGDRERLLEALLATNWNKSQAAQALRWSRMTLYRKMQKYNIGGAEVPPDPKRNKV